VTSNLHTQVELSTVNEEGDTYDNLTMAEGGLEDRTTRKSFITKRDSGSNLNGLSTNDSKNNLNVLLRKDSANNLGQNREGLTSNTTRSLTSSIPLLIRKKKDESRNKSLK